MVIPANSRVVITFVVGKRDQDRVLAGVSETPDFTDKGAGGI